MNRALSSIRSAAPRRARRRYTAPLAGLALLIGGCCCSRTFVYLKSPAPAPLNPVAEAAARLASPVETPSAPTLTEMRGVDFRIDGAIAMHIRLLRGELTSTHPGEPVNFGDKGSFEIGIHSAEVGLTADDLTSLLNRYTFAYPDAPLRDLVVTTAGAQVVQTGVVHKLVDLPFEITSDISATPEGMIRLHPTSIRICRVPGAPLMRVFHIHLDQLLDLSGARGVSVDGNDLILDPAHLLPPPAMSGRVTGAVVEGDEIVLTFGSPADPVARAVERLARPDPAAGNYMFFHGGTLHFGRLFMVQSDLQITDEHPADPLDFYIDRYVDQLTAGYSRTMPDLSLEAFVPDFAALSNE